jgi:uncharacterized protein YjbI with pentapeptide repeats
MILHIARGGRHETQRLALHGPGDLCGLTGANLSGADLTGATVAPEQLAQAKSLRGATMPDGTVHP